MKDDQGFDIVVIGASAGGVAALQRVVSALPPEFEAAVFVVLCQRRLKIPQIAGRKFPSPR
jgi:chemotaxis response regulator CheB